MGITLLGADLSLAVPGAGGTVLLRSSPNMSKGLTSRLAFVGQSNYLKNPAAFNSSIRISTPLTADDEGNIYFGYTSDGSALPGYPSGIPSGLAKVSRKGGTFIAASAICGDAGIEKVVMNCAPASRSTESRSTSPATGAISPTATSARLATT